MSWWWRWWWWCGEGRGQPKVLHADRLAMVADGWQGGERPIGKREMWSHCNMPSRNIHFMRYALYAMYSVVIFHIQYCKIQYCNIRYAIVELVGSHNILNDLQVLHWNCTETDLTFCNCSKGGKCNDFLECIEYEYVLDSTIWQTNDNNLHFFRPPTWLKSTLRLEPCLRSIWSHTQHLRLGMIVIYGKLHAESVYK